MKKGRRNINFTFEVVKNGKTIQRVRTHSMRRFLHHLRTINWQGGHPRVYLRVNYGKAEDVFGKISSFYNDGWYDNEKDLWHAFNAFKDEGEDFLNQ